MTDRIILKTTHEDELPFLRPRVCGQCGFGPIPIAVLYPTGHCKRCGIKDWRSA